MNKTFFLFYYFYPLMLNFIIILILSAPSNTNFHPINLILLLIMMTFMISLKMNLLTNSWTPFILFLIMIGGLMIIFLYITSLSSNELFSINFMYILTNINKLMIILFLFLCMNLNLLWNWNDYNNLFMSFNYINLNNFYEMFSSIYNNNMLFLMNYLFYSMICIMNICYKFKSPLRQLNN